MNALASIEAFSVAVSDRPSAVHVCLVGDANMNAVDQLGRSLADVHGRALQAGATEVVVDLRQLEFMNSACFKKVVTWITRVEEVEAASRYRIRFLSNPKTHWQRRSLHALHMFAIDLVSVDA
jgi:hypothetical protein